MDESILTRKELYDLLWSGPMTIVLTKYNLTRPELRKICVKHNIPTPEMGHWGKLKFGKPVQIRPLPDSEQPLISLLSEKMKKRVLDKTLKPDTRKKDIVSKKLSKPHHHTKLALSILAKDGFRKKWRHDIRHSGYNSLDITVSPENIRRAIRFMDAFIKLIEERAYRLTVGRFQTCVIISSQELKIKLREKLSRVEITDKWKRMEFHPNGKLSLQLDGWNKKEWVDGKRQLEEQLSDILDYLELEAEKRRKEQEAREKRWEEERRIEKLKKDLLLRKKDELLKFKKLLIQSERWHQSVVLQNFISEMEIHSVQNHTNSEDFKNWLAWARKKADWYNPFVESEDELLVDADRDEINVRSEIESD